MSDDLTWVDAGRAARDAVAEFRRLGVSIVPNEAVPDGHVLVMTRRPKVRVADVRSKLVEGRVDVTMTIETLDPGEMKLIRLGGGDE